MKEAAVKAAATADIQDIQMVADMQKMVRVRVRVAAVAAAAADIKDMQKMVTDMQKMVAVESAMAAAAAAANAAPSGVITVRCSIR